MPVIVPAKLENLQSSEVGQPELSSFDSGRAAVRIVDLVASRLEF